MTSLTTTHGGRTLQIQSQPTEDTFRPPAALDREREARVFDERMPLRHTARYVPAAAVQSHIHTDKPVFPTCPSSCTTQASMSLTHSPSQSSLASSDCSELSPDASESGYEPLDEASLRDWEAKIEWQTREVKDALTELVVRPRVASMFRYHQLGHTPWEWAYTFLSWDHFRVAATEGAIIKLNAQQGVILPTEIDADTVVFVPLTRDGKFADDAPRVGITQEDFKKYSRSFVLDITNTATFRVAGQAMIEHLLSEHKELLSEEDVNEHLETSCCPMCNHIKHMFAKANNPGAYAGGVVGLVAAFGVMGGMYSAAFAVLGPTAKTAFAVAKSKGFIAMVSMLWKSGVLLSWKGALLVAAVGPGKIEVLVPLGIFLGGMMWVKYCATEPETVPEVEARHDTSVQGYIQQQSAEWLDKVPKPLDYQLTANAQPLHYVHPVRYRAGGLALRPYMLPPVYSSSRLDRYAPVPRTQTVKQRLH